MKKWIRKYCSQDSATGKDEGGHFRLIEMEVPEWVIEAWDVCKGCGQEFYNGRENFNGECWCWHLRPEYAGMERKPKCYKAREFVI